MTQVRKKRKFELGRPPANTKLGAKSVHLVRTMGGNTKYRAMRLDQGNFSWGSEGSFVLHFSIQFKSERMHLACSFFSFKALVPDT